MKPEVKEKQKKNQEEKETVEKDEGQTPEVNSGAKEAPEENTNKTENASQDEPGAQESEEENGEEKSGQESDSEANIKEHPEYRELQDKYMRLYAEFENYRRRTAKESLELVKTANAELLEKLIPVLENFALAFSPDRKAQKLEDFEKGVKMIYNSLKDVCDEVGLEEIHPEGEEFDPNLHEALMEQHHDKVPEGHVIQVFQKGYQIQSKILKHAKVITSKGPEKEEDAKKEG